MVSAIGSSPAFGDVSATGVSTVGLEAQIARYKKELSDCINCESAKTPEGKAAIQELANKISTAEARIEKITATSKPASQPVVSSTKPADQAPAVSHAVTLTAESKSGVDSGATIGSRVNVFA